MITFNVITLFPDWINYYCQSSIVGRALKSGITDVKTLNPRDFTTDAYHKVDDSPYGGGAGMVMTCKPIIDAFEALLPLAENSKVIMTSPLGERFSQQKALEFSRLEQMVIICGHYEGIDARVQRLIPGLELISLGDFILTGGELAALAIIDATTRLLPGALGKDSSSQEESFVEGVLEYPQYTRPSEFRGLKVPEVLLSGNHAEIARWRRKMSLGHTCLYRPDLLEKLELSESDREWLREFKAEKSKNCHSECRGGPPCPPFLKTYGPTQGSAPTYFER